MKHGMRKFWLGISFLVVSTGIAVFLVWKQPVAPDLVGLAALVTAQAAGVLTIVWGNAKEHQAQANAGVK